MTYTPFAWPSSRATTRRASTSKIVVHCSATPEGREFNAADMDRMHRDRGWAGVGYHFVVLLDGTIEAGRPQEAVGSHAQGYNSTAIGVCYIGGVGRDGRTPKDTRTPEQKAALTQLLRHLKATYRGAEILGHRDLPNVAKACPSFNAKAEYAAL